MPADETPQPAPSLIVVNDPAAAGPGQPAEGADQRETVEEPAKVMRIGSMIKQLLEEVRAAPIDEASRAHLRDIYETSVKELTSGLSPDLAEELGRVKIPFQDGTPSEAELRIAQAQLVGWLEGLFHGIQATMMTQQMMAQQQLEQMRRRALPPGQQPQGPGMGQYL